MYSTSSVSFPSSKRICKMQLATSNFTTFLSRRSHNSCTPRQPTMLDSYLIYHHGNLIDQVFLYSADEQNLKLLVGHECLVQKSQDRAGMVVLNSELCAMQVHQLRNVILILQKVWLMNQYIPSKGEHARHDTITHCIVLKTLSQQLQKLNQ